MTPGMTDGTLTPRAHRPAEVIAQRTATKPTPALAGSAILLALFDESLRRYTSAATIDTFVQL